MIDIAEAYKKSFGSAPDKVVFAPGRVNLIGEHTDYNEGFVLPAAIDKKVVMALGLREDDRVSIKAVDFDDNIEIELSELAPQASKSWANYVLGVLAQFQHHGVELKGMNIAFASDVPMGSGLSSSAAVECATAFGLNELLGNDFTRLQLLKMAQKAEHEYAGVMCGIMDQYASMMGKAGSVIQLDCRSTEHAYFPFEFEDVSILLLNTNVKHSLASSAYNERRQQCEQAVAWISEGDKPINSLRQATEDQLHRYVLPKDETVYKRASYVVAENKRVESFVERLRQKDLTGAGRLMYQSHSGLSNDYEVSCKELDFLVNAVRELPGVYGARMMGGGFGGCTINLVSSEAIESIVKAVKPQYDDAMTYTLDYYVTKIGDGAGLLRN